MMTLEKGLTREQIAHELRERIAQVKDVASGLEDLLEELENEAPTQE